MPFSVLPGTRKVTEDTGSVQQSVRCASIESGDRLTRWALLGQQQWETSVDSARLLHYSNKPSVNTERTHSCPLLQHRPMQKQYSIFEQFRCENTAENDLEREHRLAIGMRFVANNSKAVGSHLHNSAFEY